MKSMISKRLLAVMATFGIAAALGAFSLVGGSPSADAQPTQAARFSVDSIELDDDTTFTAQVALDPGTSQIAAVTAGVRYDAAVLQVSDCQVDGTGVCNDVDGEVRFAALSVSGLQESDEFLTIEFERVSDARSTDLELNVETAVDPVGFLLDDVDLVDGQVEWINAEGSLTGAVTDALSAEGIYNADVCASRADEAPTCVRTGGLGNYVIDGLSSGLYTVVITDPSGVYESASVVGNVTAPEITTGMGAELRSMAVLAISPPEPPAPIDPIDPVAPDASVGPAPSSIAGQVIDATSGEAIFGLNVCATMPLVLTQSCTYTTVTGSFVLADLMTGNYELTVTDPAQRFADSAGGVYVGVTSQAGAGNVELSVERR